MKTVLIYVDTRKQVGDREHIKVFANARLPVILPVTKGAIRRLVELGLKAKSKG